jgi:hypothetical protein
MTEFRNCYGCGVPFICRNNNGCMKDEKKKYFDAYFEEASRALWKDILIWIIMVSLVIAGICLAALFLSPRPAGASHGQPGYIIHDCCRGINPASGTSYRMVAMAFQSGAWPVFERGAAPVEYILQWPRLEPTTEQLIRSARQRLAVVLTVDASPKVVQSEARESLKSQQTLRAVGMACLFGGLMGLIVLLPARKDKGSKKLT